MIATFEKHKIYENSKKPSIIISIDDYTKFLTESTQSHSNIYSDYVELSVVIKGKGIHKVLNEVTECEVGDMFILNNGVTQNFYAYDSKNVPTVISIKFNTKVLLSGDYSDNLSPNFCYGIFRDNLPISYALLNSTSLNEVIFLFERLKAESKSDKHESFEAVTSYLKLLLITVARYINLADTTKLNRSKEWTLVTTAMHEIHNNYNDCGMTLESISETLYISKSHLSRIFQKIVGQSFLDYVRNVRISNACNLLENTNLTNEEIVARCGLKDLPSFYKSFKSITGMTPKQYRTLKTSDYSKNTVLKNDILQEISEALQSGKIKLTEELVDKAISNEIPPIEILNGGLLMGMNTIAEKFKSNEVFVPTVLVASKAMNIGLEKLTPYLSESDIKPIGKVCIGTVRGDMHDIGKNLVKTFLESKGLFVIDLGIDVSPEQFVKTAIEENCKVICCSALLTTTMIVMEDIVNAAIDAGIRDEVKIIIGGAPVTEEFCKQIGADCYAPDASSAAEAALSYFR